jgi:predicted transcriptional regulator
MIDPKKIENLLKSTRLDVRAIVIIALRASGRTYREIGEALGMTKQAVHNIEQKYLEN